jgi:tRNA (adenine-N(1)-)-methyltransferase non-catalytic subunit
MVQKELLTQEEIAAMREQGLSADDIMKAQIARHERFGLKTDFSKEKWRKRKEKKWVLLSNPKPS